MRIKSITIEQLFGGDKPYHLEFISPEGVIILHAQNGMGKTTVLSMVNAILLVDFKFLDSTPFKKAVLELEEGHTLSVEKRSVFDSALEFDDEEELPFTSYEEEMIVERRRRRKNDITYNLNVPNGKELSSKLSVPSRDRIMRDGRAYDEYMMRPYMRNRVAVQLFKNQEFAEAFMPIARELPVNFIKADRLYINSSESRRMRGRRYTSQDIDQEGDVKVEAITECAFDLRDRIINNKRRKEEVSEALDRTFPKRVIELYKNKKENNEALIREQLQELEAKRQELDRIGLIGEERESVTFSSSEEFPEASLPVLEIYIEDNKKKLAAYDKLKRQIDLLLKAINESNVFTNKKLVIITENSRYAMKFVSGDFREIPLEKLSSGEKHAVILFYNLIFNSKVGSLVLIDEPEISLHISWQQHFISSLLEICKENSLYAVVATHSPDIVNNHWDLLVNLDGTPVDDDDDEEE